MLEDLFGLRGKEEPILLLQESVVLFVEAISAYGLCDKFLSPPKSHHTVALLPPDATTTAALLVNNLAILERTSLSTPRSLTYSYML